MAAESVHIYIGVALDRWPKSSPSQSLIHSATIYSGLLYYLQHSEILARFYRFIRIYISILRATIYIHAQFTTLSGYICCWGAKVNRASTIRPPLILPLSRLLAAARASQHTACVRQLIKHRIINEPVQPEVTIASTWVTTRRIKNRRVDVPPQRHIDPSHSLYTIYYIYMRRCFTFIRAHHTPHTTTGGFISLRHRAFRVLLPWKFFNAHPYNFFLFFPFFA